MELFSTKDLNSIDSLQLQGGGKTCMITHGKKSWL